MSRPTNLRAAFVLALGLPVCGQTQTVGYAVDSDRVQAGSDRLHRITLESGQAVPLGQNDAPTAGAVGDSTLSALPSQYADVEGLAFASDGSLYGIDDATKTLLRFDTAQGSAQAVAGRAGNLNLVGVLDPGLSFACDGQLYMSSDASMSLYRVDVSSGVASRVGPAGALGARISGLAARADGLYGIGVEADAGLYRINTETGAASLVGRLGINSLSFTDAGLDFAADGNLWAVIDQSDIGNGEVTRVLRIDPASGSAVQVATTVVGLEGLAISPPICQVQGTPPPAPVPTSSPWALLLLALGILVLPLFLRSRN